MRTNKPQKNSNKLNIVCFGLKFDQIHKKALISDVYLS